MSTSNGDIVTARDLHRRFGEGQAAVDALRDVTVAFRRGQFSAIMGPSGSGKSTLMHCLAGLDRPTSGSVSIDGTEITTLDDNQLTELRRDKIGFIFQAFNLLPVLTAEENIILPLTIAGRDVDRAWVDEPDLDRRPRRPPHAPAVGALRAASSSASRSPARWSPARRSSSPTSRPATSTRAPAPRCCGCCARRSTSSARPS